MVLYAVDWTRRFWWFYCFTFFLHYAGVKVARNGDGVLTHDLLDRWVGVLGGRAGFVALLSRFLAKWPLFAVFGGRVLVCYGFSFY